MKPFLTADWRYLAMLNFVADPTLLTPLVPPGTELDFENGETFLSVVGFLFFDTRVLGMVIPRHRDFEEVNLRFYVRRKSAGSWRRGVVFVRELVPRWAIVVIARQFYGEPYVAFPMKHDIEHRDGRLKVQYSWRRGSKWESLTMSAAGEPQSIAAGSHAEFITEHYWGYTCFRGSCSEYQVEHARWKTWEAESYEFSADIAALYGDKFVEALGQPPRSTFIAEGSPVTITSIGRDIADQINPAVSVYENQNCGLPNETAPCSRCKAGAAPAGFRFVPASIALRLRDRGADNRPAWQTRLPASLPFKNLPPYFFCFCANNCRRTKCRIPPCR